MDKTQVTADELFAAARLANEKAAQAVNSARVAAEHLNNTAAHMETARASSVSAVRSANGLLALEARLGAVLLQAQQLENSSSVSMASIEANTSLASEAKLASEQAAVAALTCETIAATHQVAASGFADAAEGHAQAATIAAATAAAIAAPAIVGEIREFATTPGAGWLECNLRPYLRSEHPALSAITPHHGYDVSGYTNDEINNPGDFSNGYIASNGRVYVKDYMTNNGDMWSTNDRGVTWTKHVNMMGSATWGYAYSGTGALRVAHGSSASTFKYSTDGGLTWQAAATPPSNPTNLAYTELAFDGTKFYVASRTLKENGITSGKWLAYTTNGSVWTTVALPANCQSYDWETLRATMYDTDVSLIASDATILEYYSGTFYGPSPNPGRPRILWSDIYSQAQVSKEKYIYINWNGQICLSNGYSLSPVMPLNLGASFVRAVAKIGNYSVAIGGSNIADLYLSTDSGETWNYGKDVFVTTNSQDGFVAGDDFFLFSQWASGNTYKTVRWQINIDKFIVPGIPQKQGLKSYIYAGA